MDKVRLESRGVGLRNKSGKVEGFVDPEKPSGEGENRRRNARTSLPAFAWSGEGEPAEALAAKRAHQSNSSLQTLAASLTQAEETPNRLSAAVPS